MELVVNTFETEPLPEPRETFVYINEPLLNSNYKAAVQQNFINSDKPSVFGMRQRLKFKQFNSVNAIGVVLKLSVFVIALTMMF
ncbi:hypothetical protein DFQ05_1143 [Winogradskyella wandonensis]|uniref:Uncharacterized protein n=1 Tax=Winogradskyella wandonensis TaxID=1442586 RepID=A0A4R1KSX1_9FLAO|nr:hypothetical protein [Winogradskyella wandonensis]TCK67369.1 hypothetical protein DFQ05_1143 [Winogradskyella wandonensis]